MLVFYPFSEHRVKTIAALCGGFLATARFFLALRASITAFVGPMRIKRRFVVS